MTLQAHVAEAFAECNETRRLLIEWSDAREAFFELDHADMTKEGVAARSPVWGRLGNAEAALMAYARQYQPRHEEPSIEIIPPGPYVDPRQRGAKPEEPK